MAVEKQRQCCDCKNHSFGYVCGYTPEHCDIYGDIDTFPHLNTRAVNCSDYVKQIHDANGVPINVLDFVWRDGKRFLVRDTYVSNDIGHDVVIESLEVDESGNLVAVSITEWSGNLTH